MSYRKKINSKIHGFLKSACGTEVGNRIFSSPEAPQDIPLPCVLFFPISDTPEYFFGDGKVTDIIYQISIFQKKIIGTSEKTVVEIGDLILNYSGEIEVDGLNNCLFRASSGGKILISGEYKQLVMEFRFRGF